MEWISISTIITSIVLGVVTTVGGVFCTPLCSDFKDIVEAIRNPQSLDGDSDKLKQLLSDISAMKGSEVIIKWIDEANEIMHQVDQLWERENGCGSSNHNDDHQSSCLCADACSRCKLCIKIKKMIVQGEKIKRHTPGRETVDHILDVPDIGDATTAERTLKLVMNALNGDDAWCIGVYGPGGVGKSTLAKALNNKMKTGSSFSLVKLIELKENDEQSNVQEAIAKSLKLNMGDGIENRIHNTLEKEKFLLILDNVRKSIDLKSIGIPVESPKGFRIVLTTRFQHVCTNLDAKEIQMERLTEEEAWRLFAGKAGEVVNDEEIKRRAEKVCEACICLPLSLVLVGSAMKGRDIDDWRYAFRKLNGSFMDAAGFAEILHPIRLSYDWLDHSVKTCLLYCSLYPEGYYIDINELVQCWLAENLIEGSHYTEAYSKGLSLIKKLKDSGLLEQGVDGDDWAPQTVKMHDMVRNFARWIGKGRNGLVVFSGHGVSESPIVTLPEETQNIRWIAFVDNREIELPEHEKEYTSVTTLVLRWSSSGRKFKVSTDFLKGFRRLRALNMEEVELLDASQLHLEELHTLILSNCPNIEELPNANNLKVLALSYSYLRNIPRGMEKLSNLKELDLSYTPYLKSIHCHIICNLNFLEVLNMSGSGYTWPVKKRRGSEEAALPDLSGLQCLREVYLQLAEADGTYEEFIWMGRLECFFLAFGQPASRKNEGKVFVINMDEKSIQVGTFILHADSLILHHIEIVNELFAYFTSIDQSNSKLKSMEIHRSAFDTSSTATIPRYSVLMNVEELYVNRTRLDGSFSGIVNALGTRFSKLRSLAIRASAVVVFSSDDQHIVLPELERLSVRRCLETVAFECGPAEIQTIAPNLRILEVSDSIDLVRLCNHESKEKWLSLEILQVIDCPKLKELPFMPSIKEIRGSIKWWGTVEWDSEETKSFMNRRFKPLD